MRTMCGLLSALCLIAALPAPAAPPNFLTFESAQTRPLALSPDGTRLFALNTPDARLEVFDLSGALPVLSKSVPVGLEPVALAALTDDEVWVVNLLSDSVSVVDVPAGRVKRTLLVGDEPRDVVFARDAQGRPRAFITTAHRGQQRTDASLTGVPGAGDPKFTTQGTPRADVWVFDAQNPDGSSATPTLGGRPLKIVELFADSPRGLAVKRNSGGADTVYAAAFYSGNRTGTVSVGSVCKSSAAGANQCALSPNNLSANIKQRPPTNVEGKTAPVVSVIAKFNPATGKWIDERGRDWTKQMGFLLPDKDVFAIDAGTLGSSAFYTGVGTVLFNLVVNPVTGKLYVSNSEARNETSFEGPGTYVTQLGAKSAGQSPTVQGRLHEMRVSVLDQSQVKPVRLNPHIDYGIRPAPAGTAASSLSIPTDMVVSANGQTVYVAAFGSSRIGVLDAQTLESGGAPDPSRYLPLTCFGKDLAGGPSIKVSCLPSGLALDEPRGRLYVLNRFNNSVSVIDLATKSEKTKLLMATRENADVVRGRPFLYDAAFSSSNGEASCASCHVFGDNDALAWDLGNPDATVTKNPLPIRHADDRGMSIVNGSGVLDDFHPMKGPMFTQTLRGMVNHGAMHWRGDRNGGPATAENPEAFQDSRAAFLAFKPAFEALLGRAAPPSDPEMAAFTTFALAIAPPPNPVRRLDNSLTAAQKRGNDFFRGLVGYREGNALHHADGKAAEGQGFACIECHELDPAKGRFGTSLEASTGGEPQIFKAPQLRSTYTKVGMFRTTTLLDPTPKDQVRGAGFLHDGSTDTLFKFFKLAVFGQFAGTGFSGDPQRRDVEQFLFAFDADLAPIVGQQVTLTATNGAVANPRIDLLLARARTPFVSKILGGTTTECEVMVKGTVAGQPRGWLYRDGKFKPDSSQPQIEDAVLRQLATTEGPLTYTCEPPGSGRRAGIDRDSDNVLDSLDNCPANPNGDQADADGDGIGNVCDKA